MLNAKTVQGCQDLTLEEGQLRLRCSQAVAVRLMERLEEIRDKCFLGYTSSQNCIIKQELERNFLSFRISICHIGLCCAAAGAPRWSP